MDLATTFAGLGDSDLVKYLLFETGKYGIGTFYARLRARRPADTEKSATTLPYELMDPHAGNAPCELAHLEGASLIEALTAAAKSSAESEQFQREVHLTKSLISAEEELRKGPQDVPDRPLDPDWLFRWRDYAGAVSSNDLQMLWGKVLAGELRSPGSFALRTLDFVRSLSQDEARKIEKIGPLVIQSAAIVQHWAILKECGITVEDVLELQSIGILQPTEMRIQWKTSRIVFFDTAIICNDRQLTCKHQDYKKVIDLNVYGLSAIGKQVAKIGNYSANEKYVVSLANHIANMGFTVTFSKYEGGPIILDRADELPPEAPGLRP